MRFSIIIPVYNADKYLTDSIESVITQTVNFNELIEIILVDDGSTDSSKEICLNYKKQYPNNIKYFYCNNSGPGNARNIGINAVSSTSKIIGFLDADDYLSSNTLEEVDSFLSQNESVQLAVIPLYHFEKVNKPHKLNYRFDKGNRIINILEEYSAIHFHIGGCFFRSEQFLNDSKLRFRTDLRFWEDALFINTFLLKNKAYGVISEPKYYYRQRMDEDSLVNSAWYQKSRYTDMIRFCYQELIDESIVKYGKVIPFIQYLIVYHLKLYLTKKNNHIIYEVLNTEEQKVFFEKFVKLIQQFDEKFIIEQKMPFYQKKYLLNLKWNGWPYKETNIQIQKYKITITELSLKGNRWYIEGHFKNKEYIIKETDRLFVKKNDDIYYTSKKILPSDTIIIWNTVVRDYTNAGFKITLPIQCFSFQFGLDTKDGKVHLLNRVNLLKFTIKQKVKKILRK